jgi:hypothetical protein
MVVVVGCLPAVVEMGWRDPLGVSVAEFDCPPALIGQFVVGLHGCESDGFKLQELAKRELSYGLPSEVVVCELHGAELSEPNTEWVRAPVHH